MSGRPSDFGIGSIGQAHMNVADQDRIYRIASGVLFAAALVVVLATFQDYGVTWDEHYHEAYGKYVLAYYLSGFRDTAALTYHNLWLYGGAFDGPTALVKLISPFGDYETQHLMIALVGLVGVLGCYRIATALGGPRAGFWAALLLLLTPPWYGHMFNNPKDIPFAAGMTWTLYYIIRAAPLFPDVPRRMIVKLGLAIGLTFGVRIAGAFTLVYLAAALIAWFALRVHAVGGAVARREAIRVGLRFLLPVGIIGYAVMLLAWPWAQHGLLRPFEALQVFSHNPWNLDTLFEGRLVNSHHLPAAYLPVYWAIKTPEIVLVLVLLGAGLLASGLNRARALPRWSEAAGLFTLGFAFVFPFLFFIVFRPVAYDCIRHFTFVLPVAAAIAGLTLNHILSVVRRYGVAARGAFAAVLLSYLGWHGAFMAELHPDQYVYYNQLVGGVDGAQNRYELDYWGNSYREAVKRLAAYLQDEEEKTGVYKPYKVFVCAEGSSAAYFFPKTLKLATNAREADFYISVTRLGCDKEYDGDTIITVDRDDATLSVVKDRRLLRLMAPDRLNARLGAGSMTTADALHPGLPPIPAEIP
jgi:hypothetical protein